MDKNEKIEKADEHLVAGGIAAVYCKLFSDTITLHLCALRRRELNARGIFSCDGCLGMNNAGTSKGI